VAARAALLARDAESAAADLAELALTGVHGTWTEACRTSIRAGIAGLDGRRDEALGLYRGALRTLREAGLPLDEALTSIEMATLLDPADPEVRAALAGGREILTRLAAAPFIAQLDAAVARSSGGTSRSPALPRHGVRDEHERGLQLTEGGARPPA
jgi:hypothetical protein